MNETIISFSFFFLFLPTKKKKKDKKEICFFLVHVYLRGTFCIVLVFSTALVLLEGHFERERE